MQKLMTSTVITGTVKDTITGSVSTPAQVYGVLLFGGSDATKVELSDVGGTVVLIGVNTGNAETTFVDLSKLGGRYFGTDLTVTVTGTGAIAYVWYTCAIELA